MSSNFLFLKEVLSVVKKMFACKEQVCMEGEVRRTSIAEAVMEVLLKIADKLLDIFWKILVLEFFCKDAAGCKHATLLKNTPLTWF